MDVRIYYAIQDFIIEEKGIKDYIENGRALGFMTSKQYDVSDITKVKHPSKFKQLIDEGKINFSVVDSSLVTEKETAKHFFENGTLNKDADYSLRLMKSTEIINKSKQNLNDKIALELESQNPSVINVEKSRIGILKLENTKDLKVIFEEALKGLDEKVAKGEPDKPVIRQKLIDKIAALSGAVPEMEPNINKIGG